MDGGNEYQIERISGDPIMMSMAGEIDDDVEK